MAVVTISRQYGSGGDEVAGLVRDRLGYRYFDKSMMTGLGAQTLTPRDAAAGGAAEAQTTRTLAERLFSSYPESLGDSATRHRGAEADGGEHISVELVQSLIRSAAAQGNVVVVGRGGQVVLRDRPGTLHVRIIAPVELRVARVRHAEGLGEDAARSLIKQRDKASTEYLDRFYHADAGDPRLYDLVINTGRLSVPAAADLIVKAVGTLEGKG